MKQPGTQSLTLVVLATMLLSGQSWAVNAADGLTARSIESRLLHLRNKSEREWSNFPLAPDAAKLSTTFTAARNSAEYGLLLRQQDVKQAWRVVLNGKRLGDLVRDESDQTAGFVIPAGALNDGDNVLVVEIASAKDPADDIRVGQIRLIHGPLMGALSEAALDVEVTDESRRNVPCRITIVDSEGSLVALGVSSNDELAIRAGTAYTSTGRAHLKLPAGKYTVFAGRGFEYSLARADVTLAAGQPQSLSLSIRREVPTPGYVACDTHVHTLTHSGHGDATIAERMITLAAEGIELPIATDHNVHIDYRPVAGKLGVARYFTPVIGNEVTTPRGHFNIFPIDPDSPVPDHKQTDWGLLFDQIYKTAGVKVAILNHARDLHSGVRPFGPQVYNSVVAENLEGWPLRFNAMEVVNSGATQTDPLRLFHDWMGLLNHGYQVTPIGSSDSHDVTRYTVGQGRTYIRCDDKDPGNLDIDAAVSSLLQGRVRVSYGLLTELTVNDSFTSGDLAAATCDSVKVHVRVLGAGWTNANRVLLYSNGTAIRDEAIPTGKASDLPLGVKWAGSWTIPRPAHDVHLVAIAMGPGIDGLWWRTAKPYQPTSEDPATHVLGCSGAVRLDADRDGKFTCAREYAQRLVARDPGGSDSLMTRLSGYDEATAAHAAHLLTFSGISLQSDPVRSALKSASPATVRGFQNYVDANREHELARTK